MTRIAYLAGSDFHDGVERDGEAGLDTRGNTDFFQLRTRDPEGYARLHVPPNYFRQAVRYDLTRFDTLVNLVTDPDQNPAVLATLARLVKGYRGRVINPPHLIVRTTRDRVARACASLPNVVAPRTLRLEGKARKPLGGFPFPAILRLAGTHTGHVLGIVDDEAAALAMMVEGKAHILTEFRDFKSADGLYRKYRFVFIGGEIVMRHLLVSDHWNVHAADRQRFMTPRPALIAEERDAIDYGMKGFPHGVRGGLRAIRDAIGLDMFGLDCALSGEGVLLFEANATMNFFPLADEPHYAYLGRALARAQAAFDAMLFGPGAAA